MRPAWTWRRRITRCQPTAWAMKVRGRALRVIAAILALAAAFGTLGLAGFAEIFDSAQTCVVPGFSPDACRILEGGGYGNLLITTVALPILSVSIWPRRTSTAVYQVGAVALILMLTAAGSRHARGLVGFGAVGLAALVLIALSAPRPPLRNPGVTSLPIIGLVVLAAVPLFWYALAMIGHQAADSAPRVSHPLAGAWQAVAALALAIPASAFLGVAMAGGRVSRLSAGLAALLLGVLSVTSPSIPASLGRAGGALLIAWTLVFVASSEVLDLRGRRSPR